MNMNTNVLDETSTPIIYTLEIERITCVNITAMVRRLGLLYIFFYDYFALIITI